MPLETGTFQDSASRLFNNLPNDIKLETNAKNICEESFEVLGNEGQIWIRLTWVYICLLD